MKILYEMPDIQTAIANHLASQGYSVSPDDVDVHQIQMCEEHGAHITLSVEIESLPQHSPVEALPVDTAKVNVKPKQRNRRTKAEMDAARQAELDDTVETQPEQVPQEAEPTHQEEIPSEDPVEEETVSDEPPENISVPKAPTEVQVEKVVDRMLAEEPAADEETDNAEQPSEVPPEKKASSWLKKRNPSPEA